MDVRQTLGGRYKLLNELGSGGMAVVWRARDEVLGRPVAVKLLAARYAGDRQSRERIREEARAAATLSHPNIAQVYDYGEADDDGTPLPYVVMELVNGPTLQQRVATGPLPPRTVFRVCGEVAAALAAAHADGLVHRDIKMANILVAPSGAKVVDFGIAAAVGREPEEMLVGTPAYLAPERLTGQAVLPASDVYALGVLLYRLLTNESPWSVETTTQMLQAHVYVDPAPLPPLPAVPPAVTALIVRCLHKDPEARPTASEVSATLADAAEASPVRGSDAGGRIPRPASGSAEALAGGRAGAASPVGRVATRSGESVVPGIAAAAGNMPSDRQLSGNSANAGRGEREGAAASSGISGRSAPNRPGDVAESSESAEISGGSGAAGEKRDGAPAGRGGSAASAGRTSSAASASGSSAGREAGRLRPGASAHASGRAGETMVDFGHAGGSGAGVGRTGRAGGVGGRRVPVPLKERKPLLAGVAVGCLVVALLAGWGLTRGDEPVRSAGGAPAPVTPAVSRDGGSRAGSSASRGGEGEPSATAMPGRGVVTGSRSAAVSPSAVAPGTSAGSSGSPEPVRSGEPSASASASPQGKRLVSAGGSVRAVCAQGKVTLTSWQAADGFAVERVDPGPKLNAVIVFAGERARYRMSVTCVAGTPTPVVLPI